DAPAHPVAAVEEDEVRPVEQDQAAKPVLEVGHAEAETVLQQPLVDPDVPRRALLGKKAAVAAGSEDLVEARLDDSGAPGRADLRLAGLAEVGARDARVGVRSEGAVVLDPDPRRQEEALPEGQAPLREQRRSEEHTSEL